MVNRFSIKSFFSYKMILKEFIKIRIKQLKDLKSQFEIWISRGDKRYIKKIKKIDSEIDGFNRLLEKEK